MINNSQYYLITLSLFIGMFTSETSADVRPEIVTACQTYQAGTELSAVNPCKFYIDGFIDASIVASVGGVAAEHTQTNKIKPPSSYLQRAIKYRFIESPLSWSKTNDYEFCLPASAPTSRLTAQIIKSLNFSELTSDSFREAVFNALVQSFPCEN